MLADVVTFVVEEVNVALITLVHVHMPSSSRAPSTCVTLILRGEMREMVQL